MDTPAVSFFPNTCISVDRALIDEGEIFHSRNAGAVLDYVESVTDRDAEPDRTRARRVRREVADLTADLMNGAVD
ncbi:hypothetical protein [Halogeometricum luteum]|uniref:Uncharacterized protein n=1 Tax=Halogeometricum luteum TaxID=2950537 RepID=A0ABU2G2Z3_9EURY|nr:hypothetical protein [Halogeometricum sp. S3BR5-2]MDS0295145.1 hypothetical protein [Halogeometricum sp. S3BR5-2]